MSGSMRFGAARPAHGRRTGRLGWALFVALAWAALIPLTAQAVTTWQVGDVFAGVGNGNYNVYNNSGTFKETINQGTAFGGQPQNSTGFTTGCAFNPPQDHLYTTNFSTSNVVRFQDPSPHSVDQTIVTPAQVSLPYTGAGDASSESVVFAANGDFYVGHADGTADVHKYNSAGTFIRDFDVATEIRGSDWLDLAADQQTLFYTSEGNRVLRYDLAADAQLTDFATGLPGSNAYALRILPPGDGSGGVLVADSQTIVRLDGSGNVVQQYDTETENQWFALNLDPNGTSFWSGSFDTNNFYRFNIASGAIEVGPIASGGELFGLCLKGEPTAGGPGPQPCPPGDVDNDNDGLEDQAESLFGTLLNDADSDDDGVVDGNEDDDGDGVDDEDEDDDEDPCPDDDDGDGEDDEDEDDD
jgi:hypothetical protein